MLLHRFCVHPLHTRPLRIPGVRTFEDTAAEISEGLYAADVNGEMGDSIDSYLDKLSEWRLTMQPQYLAQMGINLSSPAARAARTPVLIARGDTVILTENDSDDSKITV